jgi:hypothetical protein
MNKPLAILKGILGTCFIIWALILVFTGGPTWQIIFALAFSISTYSWMVSTLHPKDKKIYAITTAISSVCLIIIGLDWGVWGGQSTTVMAFFILGGILGLVVAVFTFFKGRRPRIRPANIRLMKTTTNNQPSTN